MENIKENNSNKSLKNGILSYDDNEKQTLFKIFGMEMTAPKGLKNPRIIYISFMSTFEKLTWNIMKIQITG